MGCVLLFGEYEENTDDFFMFSFFFGGGWREMHGDLREVIEARGTNNTVKHLGFCNLHI